MLIRILGLKQTPKMHQC